MIVRPFHQVAVVNRGEAAVRFLRAARSWRRERGEPLRVVALYTDPDAEALFVRMASAAVPLGEALVAGAGGKRLSAYLDVERVLDRATAAGADAVWPGWGFVAESPEFAEACAARDLVFLGPPAEAMRKLGDKVAAKRLAEQAGVPVAPWSGEPIADPASAEAVAARIGYPLLLKAAAGGGGRGIRRVDRADDLAGAFRAATAEAQAAFGDPAVFLERFVPVARHVEVQLLADSHGTVWALGTRDCSVQRRHQKLLEEAPAPGLAPRLERALCDSAVALARRAGYVGAGTAEYLLLPDGETFYFLEMNTRLQVEHTVTEAVYGVDLVCLQIDVARGERLPAAQPPAPRGAAIEARLNAEDPDAGFAPLAGRLLRFAPPLGPGVRVDTGYEQGDRVPTAFDSMLAKLIAHGADRAQARARLETALRDCVVVLDSGLTNRSLLLELVAKSAFRDAPPSTRWLDGYLAERPGAERKAHLEVALAAAALGDYLRLRRGLVANFLDEAQRGLPQNAPEPGPTLLRYLVGERPVAVEVATVAPETLRLRAGRWQRRVTATATGAQTLTLALGGHRYSIQRVATASEVHVDVEGVAHRFRRLSDGSIRAPLPASVAEVHVEPGERVAAGDRLVTLEVMKMETPVVAPVAGTVTAVAVRAASQVAAGEVLVELDSTGEAATAVAPLALPASGEEETLDPCSVLEGRLLGFDLTAAEAAAARAALAADPAPPRARLLSLLRAAVVQEQLFKGGPYDDARNAAQESSFEQLGWFAHHRHLDPERLSPRFIRRLRRFAELHGLREPEGHPRLANALLRLFQARHEAAGEESAIVLALLHALARLEPPPVEAEGPGAAVEQRVVFEKLANEAVQRHDPAVATAAWNLIHRWFDEPARRAAAAAAEREADERLGEWLERPDEAQRRPIRQRLLEQPPAALFSAALRRAGREGEALAVALLTERLYGGTGGEALTVGGGATARWRGPSGVAVSAALLRDPSGLVAALAALPAEDELDLWCAFEPGDAAAALLAARRPRSTLLWLAAGELRCRTYLAGERRREWENLHPSSPLAAELARFAAFSLAPLPAPAGVRLFRASAPGDERLLALGEVERCQPAVDGQFVRAAQLESVFLEAVQALRAALAADGAAKPPALNRIVLGLRQAVALGRLEWRALAERLMPATFELALEKASLLGCFDFGDGEGARSLAIEWRDPIALGPRIEAVAPRQAPVAVRTAFEQQLLAARRRRLFHPYEVVAWLTARNGACADGGQFEELDLADDGNALVSVAGRPYGGNRAGVVVGRIVNPSPRVAQGLARILLIGDATREMGSLGEPECRRIAAAIDLAERSRLPLEWVALSAGAKIAFDSGTENLDWTAAVLRRLVEFTARGGVVNVIVDGPCVGAQSYWNAEATMLMHCRGTLVMTPRGYMVLTGKRALEVSGSVAAASNEAIGGLAVMEPNGQAQYTAADLYGAYQLLLRHYEYTYRAPGGPLATPGVTADAASRDFTRTPYGGPGGFATVGEIFSDAGNPGRRKPFAIRPVLRALLDEDAPPLERWQRLAGGESAVVLHGLLGGQPVCLIGVESQPLPRRGQRPVDGPAAWTSGTLFPHSSRKVARALWAASGLVPVVVLANLSGFDGSPESLRERQLEFGAEIGRAVVEFTGPLLFCAIARYHGGAYVVFSRRLSQSLTALALEGSYASVIGGGAAAAVVFPRQVAERAQSDPRVRAARALLQSSAGEERRAAQEAYETAHAEAEAAAQVALGQEFDRIHSVERALAVGSLDAILPACELRPALIERLAAAVASPRR